MSSSSADILKSVPLPTIDRPFGIELWPIFDKAWMAVKGYHATEFNFQPGSTFMSTLTETIVVLGAYYVIIFGGREWMRNRPAYKLNGLFMIHNFALTAISAVLLSLYLEQLIPEIYHNGLFHAICHKDGGWTPKMVTLYYLNYLTKYLELIDTVFLFLKKKPLTFLHCYHHGATAFLCYTQLVGHTPVSWTVITLNLTVHVVMYWYYFQSARGIRIWWKEWITRLQILQFIIALVFIYFASYTYFTSTYFPWLPNYGTCAGEEYAAFAGIATISSYLVLFISFYIATYRKDTKRRGKHDRKVARSLRSLSDAKVPDLAEITHGKIHLTSGSANGHANGQASSTATPGRPVTRSRKA